MLDVKSVKEVLEIIDENFSQYELESESVSIEDVYGRILASDLTATDDIPGFNRSSVDGYAVISSDTFGASDSLPAQLLVSGEVRMGERPLFSLEKGQAAYVPTGGELPGNADSMVMVEYTEDINDGYIYISKASAPGNNIVFKGDDVKTGNPVLKAGTKIRPQDAGVLAAMGYSSIPVARRLKVGIISTGNEVIDITKEPVGAQVRDINSYLLHAGLLEKGVQPELYGIVNDNFDEIKSAVEKALAYCDVVLISGGSSAGMKDETSKVIDSLGIPGVLVHGIAIKPGKPTILGKIGKKAVVGLPGHPASAYVIFMVVVGHLIDVMSGVEISFKPSLRAEMACNYPSNNGREEFLPVRLVKSGDRLSAEPVFGKSGLITLLTSADGYVHLSRESEGVDKGREVEVHLF